MLKTSNFVYRQLYSCEIKKDDPIIMNQIWKWHNNNECLIAHQDDKVVIFLADYDQLCDLDSFIANAKITFGKKIWMREKISDLFTECGFNPEHPTNQGRFMKKGNSCVHFVIPLNHDASIDESALLDRIEMECRCLSAGLKTENDPERIENGNLLLDSLKTLLGKLNVLICNTELEEAKDPDQQNN